MRTYQENKTEEESQERGARFETDRQLEGIVRDKWSW